MKKVIEKIRQKPEHEQNRIIWVVAAIAIIILLGLWILLGNSKRANSPGGVINNINQEVNDNKNLFPNLFNK